MVSDPIIVWFRRDLRIADNPALLYATRHGQPVLPLYVEGWEDGDRWAPGQAGRWWLEQSLRQLAVCLAARGAPLLTFRGEAEEELPRLARDIGAGEVVWNRLYEPYPRELERRVVAGLQRAGVRWRAFDAALLFNPENHFSRSGRPFVQFTAFWRSCQSLPEPGPPEPEPGPLLGTEKVAATALSPAFAAKSASAAPDQRTPETAASWGPRMGETPAWVPGEAGAHACLERFLQDGLVDYESSRDVPGIDGTSRLSPHLHFGEIGPRQVWHAVREAAWTGGRHAEPRPRARRHSCGSSAGVSSRTICWSTSRTCPKSPSAPSSPTSRGRTTRRDWRRGSEERPAIPSWTPRCIN